MAAASSVPDIKVNLCGLGEPLLNRHTPDFVRQGPRRPDSRCSVSTNGSLLDERRGQALLDAGLQGIEINVGEEGDDYEEIYGLPFEKTCENVVRFAEMARAGGSARSASCSSTIGVTASTSPR